MVRVGSAVAVAAVTKALAGDRIVPLISTHILDDLRQTGGRVAILSEGHLVFHGSIDGLMTTAAPAPTRLQVVG